MTIFNQYIQKFEGLLIEGYSYLICDPTIKHTGDYSKTNHEFILGANKHTAIEKLNDSGLKSLDFFDLKSVDEIESIDCNTLINFLGEVLSISSSKSIKLKNGGGVVKKEI